MTYETQESLEEQRAEIEEERAALTKRNMEIMAEMSSVNTEFRVKKNMPVHIYQRLLRRQDALKKEQHTLTAAIQDLNSKRVRINQLIDAVKRDAKANGPSSSVFAELDKLRAKYREFSGDATRVSSMRLMAAQFADDLDRLCKSI